VIGTTYRDAAIAQTLEGLGRRDLVDKVEIDIENRRRTRLMYDDVIVPDFLE
jgi:hypothetical protein